MNSVIYFQCKDDNTIVRHINELPTDSIFHKSSAPLTDINRPFPIPFSSNILQQCLYFNALGTFESNISQDLDSSIMLCEMLGFDGALNYLHELKKDKDRKKGKKGGVKASQAKSNKDFQTIPSIFLLDTCTPIWDPDVSDTHVVPLRMFSPQRSDLATVDTFYLPKPSIDLPCNNVSDFLTKTSEHDGKNVADSMIQFINKHLNLPHISKKESLELSGLLPKAFSIYKKYNPQFNMNNAYHLWSFWRDSFSGKWKDLAIAIGFYSQDLDFAVRFFTDIAHVDLSGWTGMTGGFDSCNPEDLLVSSLFKDTLAMKKSKKVIKDYIVSSSTSSKHVHPICCVSESRYNTCSGCKVHPDFTELHRSYVTELHNLSSFFFSPFK